MFQPYYRRNADHIYRLGSCPEYGWETAADTTTQIIFGQLGNEFVTFKFDLDGNYISTERSHIGQDTSSHSICDVRVKRFWDRKLRVGIEDVSEYGKEACLFPSNFDNPIELNDALKSVEIWIEEGQFVFWWEQDFYVAVDGTVESS